MTTLNLQVAASADDAHEGQTDLNFSNSAPTVRCSANTSGGNAYKGGVRFVLSQAIPAGSTITTCYATIVPTSTSVDDANVDLRFEDSADAPNFATNADVHNRSLRASAAAWVADGLGTSPVNTPSLVTQLQDLVDAYSGLASGAAVVLVFVGRSDTNKDLRFVSYDSTPADAAKLVITFAGTTHEGAATLSSVGSVDAQGQAIRQSAATLASAGAVAAQGEAIRQVAAILANAATIAAQGEAVRQAAATLSNAATIAAQGAVVRQAVATVSAEVTLTPTGLLILTAVSLLVIEATLAATGEIASVGLLELTLTTRPLNLQLATRSFNLSVATRDLNLSLKER